MSNKSIIFTHQLILKPITMKSQIKFLLGGILFLTIAALTVTGHVAQVIPFAGTLNEMGFFILNGLMGILYVVAGFSREESVEKKSSIR